MSSVSSVAVRRLCIKYSLLVVLSSPRPTLRYLQLWPGPRCAARAAITLLLPSSCAARALLLPSATLAALPPAALLAATACLCPLHDIQSRLHGDQVEAHWSANGPEEQRQEDKERKCINEVHQVAAQKAATSVKGVVERSALGRRVAQL